MMLKKLIFGVVCALLLLVNSGLIHAQSEVGDYDDELADIARQAPGFGGFYSCESICVYTTDESPAAKEAIEREIRAFLGDRYRDMPIKWLTGHYDYVQLLGWYRAIVREIFSYEGVISSDIDESENHITVGVNKNDARLNLQARQAIGREIERQRIPHDAVAIEDQGPMSFEPPSYPISPQEQATSFLELYWPWLVGLVALSAAAVSLFWWRRRR